MNTQEDSRENQKLPAHTGSMYRFHVVNAFCWSVLLTSPIVLFFKHLDASATVLGLVMGVPPLFTIMQIPAAVFLEQIGYRKFMVRAWFVRGVAAVGMATVAIASPWIGAANSMVLMLGMLVVFSVIRGIGSAAMLPWFTQLIPENVRGRYLSREQMIFLLVVLIVNLASAMIFEVLPGSPGFAVIMSVGALAGVLSGWFLSRVPDVEVPEESRSRQSVPWRAILAHKPFKQMLAYSVLTMTVWSGGALFVVPLVRDQFAKSDGFFLMLQVPACASSMLALFVLGSFLDRVGSKPLLGTAIGIQVAHFSGWAMIAAGVLPFNIWTLAFQQISWGCVYGLYASSNMRLLMEIIPPVGRSHFFAIHSVASMIAAGLSPAAWGLYVDLFSGLDYQLGGVRLTPLSTGYLMIAVLTLCGSIILSRIREEKAISMQAFLNELVVKTPARALSRVIQRRNIN